MAATKRTIAIQSSKLDARLSVTRPKGSVEAFRLQLASIGEALSANASPEVAFEFMREAEAARSQQSKPSTALICAITDTTVRKVKVAR